VYNVGPYTTGEWKVVWREQSSRFQAAAVCGVSGGAVVPDHKLMLVPCASTTEQFYLAGLLGSAPCRMVVLSYVVPTAISTHVLEYLRIPRFVPKSAIHCRLATLSERCHTATAQGDAHAVALLEAEIDQEAAHLWELSMEELKGIREELPVLERRPPIG
jgi:hypothetical protein